MPGLNGTGPMGAGPMTGGQRGLCNPANSGYRSYNTFGNGMGMARGFGRGAGRGFGRGAGRGFGMGAAGNQPPYFGRYPENSDEELNMLKIQADSAQNNLKAINRRISELEKSSD